MNRFYLTIVIGIFTALGSVNLAHAQMPGEQDPVAEPAQPGQPPPPAAAPEASATQIVLGASALAAIPVGDFGDAIDFSIGALFTLDFAMSPQFDLTGRIGLIYFIPESQDGVDITFYNIPVWFGGRFALDPSGNGLFVHGEMGLNRYSITAEAGGQEFSDTETEIGMNLLAGSKMGKLVIEGGLFIGSIDEASDSLTVGGTIGTTF